MGWFIGNFRWTDEVEGRTIHGRCIDLGYCVGRNEFPDFKGTFVARFNESEILTTTTTDQLIVDEVVRPVNNQRCPFDQGL